MLAARVAGRHPFRLPSAGSLHIDDARACGDERLCDPDPERMLGDPTLDPGIRGLLPVLYAANWTPLEGR